MDLSGQYSIVSGPCEKHLFSVGTARVIHPKLVQLMNQLTELSLGECVATIRTHIGHVNHRKQIWATLELPTDIPAVILDLILVLCNLDDASNRLFFVSGKNIHESKMNKQ